MIENWKYNNIELNSIEEIKLHEPKPWGFVYLLTLYDLKTNNLKYQYIGKKNLFSVRTKYLTKAEIAASKKSELKRKKVKGVFKYYKTVINESDWKDYISSNLFIKKNLGRFRIEREILFFSTNDSDLSYQEAKEIICQGALENDNFLNDGVSLRRFGGKLIK